MHQQRGRFVHDDEILRLVEDGEVRIVLDLAENGAHVSVESQAKTSRISSSHSECSMPS